MPKLTIDLDIQNVTRAVDQLKQVASVVQSLSSGKGSAGVGGSPSGGGGGAGLGQMLQMVQGAQGMVRMVGAVARVARVAMVLVAALRPLAIVALVVYAAFKVMSAAARFAAERLMAFGKVKDALGSNSAQAAMLRQLGQAVGVGDVAGSAARMHEASKSGLGAATAVRYGVPLRHHEIGEGTNRGEMFIQALEGLRRTFKEQGYGAAVADARNLNMEDWFQVVYLLDEQWARLRKDAEATGQVYTQDRIAKAAQLNFELKRMGKAWDDLKVEMGSAFLRIIRLATRGMEWLSRGIVGMLRSVLGWVRNVAARIPGLGGVVRTLDNAMAKAMGENTQALRQNTSELRQLNGVYGGGSRARGALPGAFGPGAGYELGRALRSHTVRLGAYAVGL